MVDQEAWVRWNVDLSKVTAGTAKLKATIKSVGMQTRAVSKEIDDDLDRMSKKIDVVKAGWIAMAGVVAYQGALMAAETARFADSAAGVERYFDRSFGSMADEAREWAEDLSESYGVYSGDVERFMAKMNDGFYRAGNGMAKSYEMAKDFTALSYDLAKVYSGIYSQEDIADWLNDLAVGGGEEALEKLLPGFDEESLKVKAYSMRVAEAGEELSVLAKQQAAHQLLLEAYSEDIGRYGEGTESATAATRRLNAAFLETKEVVGTALGPAVAEAAGIMADALSFVADQWERSLSIQNESIRNWKDFLNGVADFFGMDQPFDMDDEDTMIGQTSKLNVLINSITQSTEEAKKAMVGLLGFDRLNILKTSDEEKVSGVDHRGAAEEWMDMFVTNPSMAVDKLDALWGAIIDGNADTAEEMRDDFGQYFDWLLAEELENTSLSVEERQRLLDEYYEKAAGITRNYLEYERIINESIDEAINQARLEGDENTIMEMENLRQDALDQLRSDTEDAYADLYSDLLIQTEVASQQQAEAMVSALTGAFERIDQEWDIQMAQWLKDLEALYSKTPSSSNKGSNPNYLQNASDKVNQTVSGLIGGVSDVVEDLKEIGDKIYDVTHIGTKETAESIDNALMDFGQAVINQASKELNDRMDSFNNTLKHLGIGDGVGWFANGGVFEPNKPMLVGVGDNTREREVIAPESMIESAVERVLTRHQGSNRPMEITVISQIDGRQVAKATYKYTQQESLRRGKTA